MKLIDYLPPKLKEIKELADIQEAIEPELKQIEKTVRQYLINKNPLRADREGIEQWEAWLKITPDPNDSLRKRGERILSQLNERLPYTMPQLYNMLIGILGEENFTMDSPAGRAVLNVDINALSDAFDSVYRLLKHVVPAHVLWKLRTYLNTDQGLVTTGSFATFGITVTLYPYEVRDMDTEIGEIVSSGQLTSGQVITLPPKGD